VQCGNQEGKLLEEGLRLCGVASLRRPVTDAASFGQALIDAYAEASQNKHLLPVLHFSAHGNNSGIELTDGTFITWSQLEPVLEAFNCELQGNLCVCMSSCNGYLSATHALGSADRLWKVLVGNIGSPTWNDTAIGFASFYHLLAKGKTVDEAVAGMRAASGNADFRVIDGEKLQSIRKEMVRVLKYDPQLAARLRAAVNLASS